MNIKKSPIISPKHFYQTKTPKALPSPLNKSNSTNSVITCTENQKFIFDNKELEDQRKTINKNSPKKSLNKREIRKIVIIDKSQFNLNESDEVEESVQFTSRYFK